MAVEFGITQRPGKNKHQQLNVEAFVERPKGLSAVDAELWDPVARRAYLGCYQMTTWLVGESCRAQTADQYTKVFNNDTEVESVDI